MAVKLIVLKKHGKEVFRVGVPSCLISQFSTEYANSGYEVIVIT